MLSGVFTACILDVGTGALAEQEGRAGIVAAFGDDVERRLAGAWSLRLTTVVPGWLTSDVALVAVALAHRLQEGEAVRIALRDGRRRGIASAKAPAAARPKYLPVLNMKVPPVCDLIARL